MTKKHLSKSAWLMIAAMIAVNFLAYYGARLLNRGLGYDIALPLDHAIPFVPAFILVYVLAYLQWIAGYTVLARDNEADLFYFCTGVIVAKVICALCFILFPTRIVGRPMPEGTDFISFLTRFIFLADTPPDNLLPSIHCLESWITLRILFRLKRIPRAVQIANAVFTLLVFASVVLVKQHVLLDIPAGVLTAEIGLAAARLILRKRRSRKSI